jgi:hypothetical protein
MQANGTIVVAGFASNGTNDDFAVARLQGDPLQRMYRLYNPKANFHFFTTSQAEFQFASANGYRDETTSRTGFAVTTTQLAGSLPLHRLYNPNKGSHYYTTSDGERDTLVSLGWRYERDEGFVFTSQVSGTVEVYRLWNRDSGVHLFTESPTVRDAVLRAFPGVWEQHASVGFAYPVAGLGDAQAAARTAAARAALSHTAGVRSEEAVATSACDIAPSTPDPSNLASQLESRTLGLISPAENASTKTGEAELRIAAPDAAALVTDNPSDDLAWMQLGLADWAEF